jgi:imidazolonepropionase-like amidohydrolase
MAIDPATDACGLTNCTGGLQARLAADLLIVDGNPLVDRKALR